MLLTTLTCAAAAQTETILLNFNGANGSLPTSSLILDSSGNLYGVTQGGGAAGFGTVYKLSPPATEGDAWVHTMVWNFAGGADGSEPVYALAIDKNGALYGVTAAGGDTVCACGTVFKLKPPALVGAAWEKRILHAFTGSASGGASGNDGNRPSGGVILDAKGAVYGVTSSGGINGAGTIYKINSIPGGRFTETVLFNAFPAQSLPNGSLVFDSAGNLDGVDYFTSTIYQIAPPASGAGTWTYIALLKLAYSNGCYPEGGLIIDAYGQLYGTATYCGALGYGAIFQLKPPASPGAGWTANTLHSFEFSDGFNPDGKLYLDQKSRALYGASFYGGADGDGTVFKVTPPTVPGGAWSESVVYSFGLSPDGVMPEQGVVMGANGVLYGVTAYGGADGMGIVYSIAP